MGGVGSGLCPNGRERETREIRENREKNGENRGRKRE